MRKVVDPFAFSGNKTYPCKCEICNFMRELGSGVGSWLSYEKSMIYTFFYVGYYPNHTQKMCRRNL